MAACIARPDEYVELLLSSCYICTEGKICVKVTNGTAVDIVTTGLVARGFGAMSVIKRTRDILSSC